MRRFGRKASDERVQAELPLSVFLFDCLFVDGESLLDRPLHERMSVLDRIAPDIRVPCLRTGEPAAAHRFLRQALDAGHEGIMVKTPAGRYAAGSRGADWLKVKEAHTLDLVVLAAEWGSGRRRGWLSNLHLGARDPDGGFVMLGKTFKGLTDTMLRWQTERLRSLATREEDRVVHVRPELVVEIAVNEIQRSPQYPAGLALRFARVRAHRDDKRADEADTIDTVRALFDRQ
jgi:DNA ligase-1